MIRGSALMAFACAFFSCTAPMEEKPEPQKPTVSRQEKLKDLITPPDFNADSAYFFIKQQVDFGPRVPGSEAHKKCAFFLEKKLKNYGMEVLLQKAELAVFTGKKVPAINIIGRYLPEEKNRILLMAHWDTRPFADRDKEKRTQPIDGANDGASGVAVLLEIARQIHLAENKPPIGIDIIFFDVEDYGQPQETMMLDKSNTWCLGSQHWARNPHVSDYRAKYGILLDMVGAKNAIFPKEGHSMHYAAPVVEKVWKTAARLGYAKYFIDNRDYRGLTDDHYYINTIAHIPSIDIVHYDPYKNDFGDFHHTHKDNMSIIDKETLYAVGHTLLDVVFNEK
jgi:glutaminyl-peptide cyclotransferase